jgi:hypothetical protein
VSSYLAIRETSAKPSMNQSPRPCMIPTIQRLPERLKTIANNKPMAKIPANIHKCDGFLRANKKW